MRYWIYQPPLLVYTSQYTCIIRLALPPNSGRERKQSLLRVYKTQTHIDILKLRAPKSTYFHPLLFVEIVRMQQLMGLVAQRFTQKFFVKFNDIWVFM